MERDGFVDLNKMHIGSKDISKKNPLMHNKGFGSPGASHSGKYKGRIMSKDTFEEATSLSPENNKSGFPGASEQFSSKSVLHKSSTFEENKENGKEKEKENNPTLEIKMEPFNSVVRRVSTKITVPLTADLYKKMKSGVDCPNYMKEMWRKKEVSSPESGNKTPHTMQAIKYKLEAFTPPIIAKYAKDTTTYGGIFIISYKIK